MPWRFSSSPAQTAWDLGRGLSLESWLWERRREAYRALSLPMANGLKLRNRVPLRGWREIAASLHQPTGRPASGFESRWVDCDWQLANRRAH